ncbi:secretin N-terminal domain-containing protein [Thermomonas carbonis]|uniref:Type II secretion system protein GspD n=2 Tax=Thermomonas carbonis TaxID=1463158 RepID=A0A7G9SU72_9GAMM|nr:type II secretion system protein GspD [Thermomonas carbonis]QNN71397.1 type II secretion system protein GspD [Thermomonas carbonis]
MPVPAFINEFFGSILGVGFQMDPQVSRMNDLVTLRTSGPQSPRDFYRLAVQVLRTYGVGTEYTSGMVMFNRARDNGGSVPPLVVSGRTLPDVPITHRPVFQLVELQSVRVNDVISLLNMAFKSDALTIQPDNSRNAIVLMGRPELVRQALDAIRVFDRPYMRGRTSARLEPAFVTADELSRRLVDVLSAEGYGASLYTTGSASGTAVLVLPLTSANAVLVFSADRAVLEHAIEWARSIDRPNPTAGTDGLFYYTAKNTKAEEIAKTISGVRSASTTRTPSRETVDGSQGGSASAAPAAPAAGEVDLSRGKLIPDEPRNALIFQGTATDWGRLLPLIQQMDKAPRQVMIEVTVAEVTLTDEEEFGVSWLARNSDLGKFNGNISSGVLGTATGGSGLNYILDIGGQARASLKALATLDRISVLSTPRLMVKSGEEASLDVGTEVPTISSQATGGLNTGGGGTGFIQTVQYRKTGILLNIKPVVYSDDRVDIELRQEVSEALPLGADSGVSSPAIFNRSYSTSLSLKDGSAIMIAGLMSQRQTNGSSGVPYLKDVPVLGNLFKSQKRKRDKTELVLMIVPYIIETDTQAEELTRSLSQRFELLELPPSTTQPSLVPVMPSAPVRGQDGDGSVLPH